jgi:hypothetical protein
MIKILHPICVDDHERLLSLIDLLIPPTKEILTRKNLVKVIKDGGRFGIALDGITYQTYQYGGYIWWLDNKGILNIRSIVNKSKYHISQSIKSFQSNSTKYIRALQKYLSDVPDVRWLVISGYRDSAGGGCLCIKLTVKTTLDDVEDIFKLTHILNLFRKYHNYTGEKHIRWL